MAQTFSYGRLEECCPDQERVLMFFLLLDVVIVIIVKSQIDRQTIYGLFRIQTFKAMVEGRQMDTN